MISYDTNATDFGKSYVSPKQVDLPRLMLNPAPNGGWVVSKAPNDMGAIPETLGAYSSTEDMLEALRQALG
ncbi:hypothetical protein [Phaeobacter italicus]|jgi:hypothetical protein|uniref:hypothetical protein n=1 Tax=Phaeobacter italicus TaxID=481446 RepID=UPI002FDD38CF